MPACVIKSLGLLTLVFLAGEVRAEGPAKDAKPGWARAGERLNLDCNGAASGTAESTHGDAVVRLTCPVEESLRIRYTKGNAAALELLLPLKELREGQWRPQEILWSGDGSAFLINGSHNAYAGVDFFVFRVEGNALVRKSITPLAQADMLERLARCWPYVREIVGGKPQFNMAAVSWKDDSLKVFAEVPCNSTFENSMCSVYGYEMNARTGAISKVLPAAEVNNTWYMDMSWKMAASDLPSCDPHTGKVH